MVLLDGERLSLVTKNLGLCEVYPQSVSYSPGGRFVVACGDDEYLVCTATDLQNTAFGSGLDVAWSTDPDVYAVRENTSVVRICKDFKVGALSVYLH